MLAFRPGENKRLCVICIRVSVVVQIAPTADRFYRPGLSLGIWWAQRACGRGEPAVRGAASAQMKNRCSDTGSIRRADSARTERMCCCRWFCVFPHRKFHRVSSCPGGENRTGGRPDLHFRSTIRNKTPPFVLFDPNRKRRSCFLVWTDCQRGFCGGGFIYSAGWNTCQRGGL